MLADSATIDQAIPKYSLPLQIRDIFVGQNLLRNPAVQNITSSEEELLGYLEIIFKTKKLKRGLFLDSYDDSDYKKVCNSLEIKGILLRKPTMVLSLMGTYSF